MENCWLLDGEKCLEFSPSWYGFVYKITNLENGWIYIGRKAFEHTTKFKLSKKAKKESGTKKRIGKKVKDSGWKDYFGSSEYLLADLEKNGYNCKREILKLCKSKIDLTYWESYYLFINNVLFLENCYNMHILGKFYKNKISK